jgi:hypothetical protein
MAELVGFPHPDHLRTARNPPRMDAKCRGHFPEADLNEAAGTADASRVQCSRSLAALR